LDQLLGIAGIILPVFGVIGLGYVAGATGLLKEKTAEGVSDYVYTIAIPLLIFRTLVEAKFPDVLPWSYWLAYFLGAFASWIIVQTAALYFFKRRKTESIIYGVSSAQSNIVLVGIPIVLTAYGEAGAVPLFLLVAVNLPVMLTTASLLIEGSGSGGLTKKGLLKLARVLTTNLLLIGFVLGLFTRLLGLAPGGAVKGVVDLVAASAVPCALFAMGLSLRHYGIAGDLKMSSLITAAKLMIHPLIVFLIVRYWLELPPVFAGVAIMFAAMPSGINAYLLAERYRTGVGASAGAVSLSTVTCIVTLAFWMWMLGLGVR
jgi:malonate transporter and related proteins